jgi:hypothetical protein
MEYRAMDCPSGAICWHILDPRHSPSLQENDAAILASSLGIYGRRYFRDPAVLSDAANGLTLPQAFANPVRAVCFHC